MLESIYIQDEVLSLSPDYSTTRRLIFKGISPLNVSTVFGLESGHTLDGGLRSKGYYKISSIDKPLISVITVVMNRKEKLVATIRSVLSQSYDNIEYILIDGSSTDGTLDVIKSYDQQIDYWISEPDGGLYEAMNKGIRASSGDWILILNSDDTLLDREVLDDVSKLLNTSDEDIVHGNINVRYPSGRVRVNIPSEISNLKKKMCLNHGGCFIKRLIHQDRLYNTAYKIAADYDFLLWAYLTGRKFKYIDKNIIEYSSMGLTGTPNFGDFDSYRIWHSYFGLPKALVLFIKDQAPKFLKVPVKKIMIHFGFY
jgi:glycosyltransferase involved in cell wall biosynthesis